MKQNILKLVALSLLVSTAFAILTRLSNAQVSGNQKSSTTTIQAAPPEKSVEQVFKNIKVLNGMPQSQFYPAMRFMAASLGTQCGFCHVFKNGQLDSPADDKPEKQTAREMIKMVLDINKTLAQGNPTVSCYMCHRGRTSPQGFPTLPLPLPSQRSPLAGGTTPGASARTAPNSTPGLPSADEILNKYTTAIGGRTAIDQIQSCVIKGTASTSSDLFTGQHPVQLGQFVSYEADQVAPDRAYETFIIQNATYERVINGPRGWLKNGAGMTELIGQQLAEQKLSFPLFMILRLKDQYASLLVSAQDKIDDRDVYVVNAIRPDNKRERLYFDIESGLLRRRISYTPTIIGIIPQQTDFEDYREVEGLRLPFTIRASYVDAGSPIATRKFAEIRLNTPVDESKFK
jgi:photosynthetic reaction center cytochrome c subunit